jgi:hypothetical protein
MLDCVKNIRQTNEKTETCMKAEMNKIEELHNRIEKIYHKHNVEYPNKGFH